MINFQIRQAEIDDSAALSRLATVLSEKYVNDETVPGAAARLRTHMDENGMQKNLRSGYCYYVAEVEKTIVGMIGIKDHRHIIHLFVDDDYQRQGIARRLWETARHQAVLAGNQYEFTVSASLYAQAVYERLGFVADSGPVQNNGVVFVPMRYRCN